MKGAWRAGFLTAHRDAGATGIVSLSPRQRRTGTAPLSSVVIFCCWVTPSPPDGGGEVSLSEYSGVLLVRGGSVLPSACKKPSVPVVIPRSASSRPAASRPKAVPAFGAAAAEQPLPSHSTRRTQPAGSFGYFFSHHAAGDRATGRDRIARPRPVADPLFQANLSPRRGDPRLTPMA